MEEITLVYVDLALARAIDAMSKISVHRLIQMEFRLYLNRETQELRWKEAALLLHRAFPQQRKGFALFNEWRVCESLIEHVQVLAEQYRLLDEAKSVAYLESFVYLVSDASRCVPLFLVSCTPADGLSYLLEIGRYNASENLLRIGFRHSGSERSIPQTNLCVNMGQVFCERGQDFSALHYNDIVLDVRQAHLDPSHSEIANALSNSALSMVGCGKELDKALQMLLKSLEIDLSNPVEDHSKVLHLRHFNTAFAYRALGQLDKAREHVKKASACAEAEFGPESRYLTM